MYAETDVINLIKKFINLISEEISLREVYLFGSYANGDAGKYSDIDLAIVSDDFEGSRFWDKKKLNKYLLKSSSDIEIHPFTSEDFQDTDPFVLEIKRTGKKIL